MNFTRDPIIETVITPKEGYKLVLRNCKGQTTQEDFFVDSVQVILLGQQCFYTSSEKPKPFIVPAGDYEVLEVRETRMALKLPGHEKGGIKIAGGREMPLKAPPKELKEEVLEETEKSPEAPDSLENRGRRKDKKRFKKRRELTERDNQEEEAEKQIPLDGLKEVSLDNSETKSEVREEKPNLMIPPPSTLISETISRYKDIPGFASAFFSKKEEEKGEIEQQEPSEEPIAQEVPSSEPNEEI